MGLERLERFEGYQRQGHIQLLGQKVGSHRRKWAMPMAWEKNEGCGSFLNRVGTEARTCPTSRSQTIKSLVKRTVILSGRNSSHVSCLRPEMGGRLGSQDRHLLPIWMKGWGTGNQEVPIRFCLANAFASISQDVERSWVRCDVKRISQWFLSVHGQEQYTLNDEGPLSREMGALEQMSDTLVPPVPQVLGYWTVPQTVSLLGLILLEFKRWDCQMWGTLYLPTVSY